MLCLLHSARWSLGRKGPGGRAMLRSRGNKFPQPCLLRICPDPGHRDTAACGKGQQWQLDVGVCPRWPEAGLQSPRVGTAGLGQPRHRSALLCVKGCWVSRGGAEAGSQWKQELWCDLCVLAHSPWPVLTDLSGKLWSAGAQEAEAAPARLAAEEGVLGQVHGGPVRFIGAAGAAARPWARGLGL